MKWIKTLFAAFVAVALTTTPCLSKETIRRDANGDKWRVDSETDGPGFGGDEADRLGAIIGAVDDTLASFEKHKFDIQLGLSAFGTSGDDSSGTETAITGLTVFYRPETYFRIGPQISWNAVDRSKVTLGLPMGFLLNPDPWDAYKFWLAVNVLPTFTVRTGEVDGPRQSAWSWVPNVGFRGEIPMGSFSLEGGLGAGYPFAIEGVTDSGINPTVEKPGFSADLAVNFRIRQ